MRKNWESCTRSGDEIYGADNPPAVGVFQQTILKQMYIAAEARGARGSRFSIRDPSGNMRFVMPLPTGSGGLYYYVRTSEPSGKWSAFLEDAITGESYKREVLVKSEVAKTAEVKVTSEPSGATVNAISFAKVHTTPATIKDIPPRVYMTSIGIWKEVKSETPERKAHQMVYNMEVFDLTLNSGDKISIHKKLIPCEENTYPLNIISCPAGAQIYIEGEYRGITPLSIPNQKIPPSPPAGRPGPSQYSYFKCIAKLSGYEDYSFTAKIPSVPKSIILRPVDQFGLPGCGAYKTKEECEVNDCFWRDGKCYSGPALVRDVPVRRIKWTPIPPGVNIGVSKSKHWGTITCVVLKHGKKMLMTNNHVLTADGGAVGDRVWQGGGIMRGVSPEKQFFGKATQIIPVRSQPVVNEVDIGLVEIDNQGLIVPGIPISDGAYEPCIIPKGVSGVQKHSRVKKSGARSGFTEGIVMATNATLAVNYRGEDMVFKNLIITEIMGIPGDSGSLGLDTNNKAFGVLFAGSPVLTAFIPISPCLEKLGCTLYTQEGAPPYIPPKKSYIKTTTSPTGAQIWFKKH